MSIESALKKWVNSKEGQKKIKECVQTQFEGGGSIGGYTLHEIIEDARRMIVEGIPIATRIVKEPLIDENDIFVSQPKKLKDGSYQVDFVFSESAVKRQSLEPDRFPKGVTNIVSLFTHGWGTPGSDYNVHGPWRDREDQWALSHREPDTHLIDAVNAFNAKYEGICTMVLSEEYTG